MKKFAVVIFILALISVVYAQAQEVAADPVTTAEAVAAEAIPAVAADPVVADPVVAPETVGDAVVETVNEVPGVVDQIKHQLDEKASGKVSWLLAICAILSIVFKFIISGLKRFSVYFSKNKTLLRVIPLILGVLVMSLDKFVVGGAWWEAIMMGISGPGAIMVHELTQIVVPKKK